MLTLAWCPDAPEKLPTARTSRTPRESPSRRPQRRLVPRPTFSRSSGDFWCLSTGCLSLSAPAGCKYGERTVLRRSLRRWRSDSCQPNPPTLHADDVGRPQPFRITIRTPRGRGIQLETHRKKRFDRCPVCRNSLCLAVVASLSHLYHRLCLCLSIAQHILYIYIFYIIF